MSPDTGSSTCPGAPDGPAGTWQQVIWKIIETGASRQGVIDARGHPGTGYGATATFCISDTRRLRQIPEEIRVRGLARIKGRAWRNDLFKRYGGHGARGELPLTVATISLQRRQIRITEDWRLSTLR
jgi:hypothetical protein